MLSCFRVLQYLLWSKICMNGPFYAQQQERNSKYCLRLIQRFVSFISVSQKTDSLVSRLERLTL